MPIECNVQGQIEVNAIVEAVNQNESDIALIGGSGLGDDVQDNTDAITALNGRVVTLENDSVTIGDIVVLEGRVSTNEAGIATNTDNITLNTADIVTLGNDASALTTRVNTNESAISVNTGDIAGLVTNTQAIAQDVADNASDIAALQALSGTGGEAIFAHEEVAGVDGGSSTTGTWTARNIATEKSNDIGAVGGATSVTFDAGTYDFEVHTMVVGSANQTRINVGGTTFIYGLSNNAEGISRAIGRVTFSTPTVVSVETNVDLGVATNGFGLSNTFGTPNTYVTFHAEKVG